MNEGLSKTVILMEQRGKGGQNPQIFVTSSFAKEYVEWQINHFKSYSFKNQFD